MHGLDIIGARTKQVLVGAAAWDNSQTYPTGSYCYNNGRYYRALRDVTPPFLPSLQSGDVPGDSDAWREVSAAEALGNKGVLGVLIGADVDVDALIERFDSLDPTNRTVWSLWVDNGHGAALDQRVSGDAQKMLNEAIIPTTEFSFHDAVMAFHKRYMALSDKVTAQPLDDNKSPIWADVKAYFVDGSKFANLLEGTADQTLKWSDVKAAAHEAAQGAGKVIDTAASTAKWTMGLLIGGAVVLGAGALYAVYKIASGPTGKAVASRYLP
jgi:hypothetical protein